MELKARLNNAYRDISTNKVIVQLEVDYQPKLDDIQGKELRVEIKQWRERRSKAANDYFHVLCRKISEKVETSETEAKNILLSKYGQGERLGDGSFMTIHLLDSIPWTQLEWIHVKPSASVSIQDGQTYRKYYVIRGSHLYDTQAMSRLIDMTVEDAKELGIETLPPNEIERMKQFWVPERASSENLKVVSSAEAK